MQCPSAAPTCSTTRSSCVTTTLREYCHAKRAASSYYNRGRQGASPNGRQILSRTPKVDNCEPVYHHLFPAGTVLVSKNELPSQYETRRTRIALFVQILLLPTPFLRFISSEQWKLHERPSAGGGAPVGGILLKWHPRGGLLLHHRCSAPTAKADVIVTAMLPRTL